MRWVVTGADISTGKDRSIVVEAKDAADARAKGNYSGLLVESVTADERGEHALSYATPRRKQKPAAVPVAPLPALPPAPIANSETLYHWDGWCLVTNRRVVVGGTVYALANVTSVRTDTKPADTSGLGIGLILAGIIAFFGLALLSESVAMGVLILIAAGLLAWLVWKNASEMKPTFTLIIGFAF